MTSVIYSCLAAPWNVINYLCVYRHINISLSLLIGPKVNKEQTKAPPHVTYIKTATTTLSDKGLKTVSLVTLLAIRLVVI